MGRTASTGRGRGRGRGRGAATAAKERTAAAKARAAEYQRDRRAAAKAAAGNQTRGRGRGSAKAATKGRGRGSATRKEEAVRKKAAKTRAAVEKKRGSLEEHVDKSEPGRRRSSKASSLALKDDEEPRRRFAKKQTNALPPSSRKRSAAESSQSHREGHSRASREPSPARHIPDESVSGGPFRGHYDVLQLRRSANAAEVREGFRRKALATHPDKGGRPEDFRAVVTAFEVLSDGARRAEYDKSLLRSGNTDGLVAPEVLAARQAKEAPMFESGVQDQYYELQAARRAQRDAIIRLTSTVLARRQAFLKTLNSSMLQGMAQWLTASATRSMQLPSDGAIAGSSASHGKGSTVLAGIHADPSGRYAVEIHWLGMKFRTFKTWSLAEAIDWHITLTQLKATAMARFRARADDEEDEETSIPLTEDELALGYQASPTMRLSFMSQHNMGSFRFITPSTPNLSLALDIKARFAAVLREHRSDDSKSKDNDKSASSKTEGPIKRPATNAIRLSAEFHAQIKKLKQEVVKLTSRERFDREALEKELLQAVHAELSRRGPEALIGGPQNRNEELNKQEWKLQANAALKLRDLLELDHAGTCEALKTLKALPPEHLAAARAILLGQALPALQAVDDQVGSEDFDARAPTKKRRTSASGPESSAASRPRRLTSEPASSSSARLPSPPPPPRTEMAVYEAVSAVQDHGQRRSRSSASKPEIYGDVRVICAALRYAALPEWCALRACSSNIRAATDKEFTRCFEDFVYLDNLFQWENRSVYTGRARPTPHVRLAQRLTNFLTSPYHSSLFAHLDLGQAPMETLQDRRLHLALGRMKRLHDVVFPQHGWAGSAERTRFLSSLPQGTSAWGKTVKRAHWDWL